MKSNGTMPRVRVPAVDPGRAYCPRESGWAASIAAKISWCGFVKCTRTFWQRSQGFSRVHLSDATVQVSMCERNTQEHLEQ